ncbi:MAG: glycosyltransferase, partial [Blastocatellia bacterium]|nr:glycosyltransferase [Blastocatellia bacterium]
NDDEFQSVLIAGTVPAGEESMNYLAEQHGIEPVFIEAMSRELSPKDVVSLFKILGEIRRQRPDIIHTHTAKAGTVGRGAALLYRWSTFGARRVAVVHTFHGHVFHSYYGKLKTSIFITIEKLLARLATDKIVVISRQQFHEIHETYGVGRPAQFEIIPLGIDVDAFNDPGAKADGLRTELGAQTDELLVGFVGRLTEIKDISLYLHIAAQIRDSAGADQPAMRFVIAGDGHLRKSLELQAAHLGLGESIVFLGNRSDTEAVYAGLDIVALTSLNEGTPLSLIEAMAAGRPVISTMVGGVRDLLGNIDEPRDGFNVCERGIGVESRSPDDFKKGLIYLAKNENVRKRLGDAGRSFVRSEYAKERLVKDIKQLYRRLALER